MNEELQKDIVNNILEMKIRTDEGEWIKADKNTFSFADYPVFYLEKDK